MYTRPLIRWSAAMLAGFAATTFAHALDQCSLDNIRALAPDGANIDQVTHIATPVAHCEVLGHTITRDPGPNRVEWTVMLPDYRFNGRYYFVGLGAAAGVVPTTTTKEPIGQGYIPATLKLLGAGFAVAGTDTGHKGSRWDFAIDNPAAKLDHGHRGAHVAAVATQAITKSYYGMKDKLYRYHLGCSGGGRMGAMAALHHPGDYDGIVASTGFGKGGSMWFPWILQHLINHPEGWISPAKLQTLERAVADHCAGPDGLVRDPNACGFDPASLRCQGQSTDQCLTDAEIAMVERITSRHPVGPDDTSGGFTLTNPTGWSSFLLGTTRPTNKGPENPWAPEPAPFSYGLGQSILRGMYFNDANFNLMDLDFDNPEHLQTLADHHADWGGVSPDLSAFKKAGGKLILWAPLGENAVPPWTEIEYYHAVKETVPDMDDFMRLYLVPGVQHCAGGPGPQDSPARFLDNVIAWAEQGDRPGPIVTSADEQIPRYFGNGAPSPARTVLVCPYPQTAVFKGEKGAFAYDARNWRCE
ncbi:MAG: hypothetical protein CMK32_14840 [Porticoccaceae bacterium]|nr:hypothetical protein [Porticoccaceae bacterium]